MGGVFLLPDPVRLPLVKQRELWVMVTRAVTQEHGLGRVSMRPHGSEVVNPPRGASICQLHARPAGLFRGHVR